MNKEQQCPHLKNGWCLNCVNKLEKENANLRKALSRASKKCDHMHHDKGEYHRLEESCPVEEWVLGTLEKPGSDTQRVPPRPNTTEHKPVITLIRKSY